MFYSNYQELENSVVDWMDRQDIRDKVPQFTRFVTTAVAKLLRVQIMERKMVVPVYQDGSAAIPFDLTETISVSWLSYDFDEGTQDVNITGRQPLNRGSVNRFEEARQEAQYEVCPKEFTDIGRKFYIYPIVNSDDILTGDIAYNSKFAGYIEVTYYALPVELDAQNTSNWILEISPELYFYGCMMHANRFTRNFDAAEYWENKYNREIDTLQKWSDKAEEAGGPIVVEAYNGN